VLVGIADMILLTEGNDPVRRWMSLPRVGTGALIGDECHGLWWCLGPRRFWRTRGKDTIITFTAIGGKVLEGEALHQAALRETKEETGVDAEVISSGETLRASLDGASREWLSMDFSPAPLMIHDNTETGYSVAAYRVSSRRTLFPHSEIPALVRFPFGREPVSPTPLASLLAEGAELVSKETVPAGALIAPFGTAQIWAILPSTDKRRLLEGTQ